MEKSEERRAHLESVYCATAYCADLPAGRLVLRIGRPCPALDEFMRRHQVTTWAFVSAHNPGSQYLPPEENQRRHDELEERIRRSGYPYLPGEGVGEAASWPPEKSLLIIGITEEAAADLARDFGQLAIVMGELQRPARLLWLD
jgi:hypothetical protein